jgi:membrane-bound lytic murein transglycosylase B
VLLLIAAFGGLPDAIETSAAPPAVAEIPPEHLAVMQQVRHQTGIPWQILAAVSKVESGFGANPVLSGAEGMGPSSAGAVGYCQFMPSTWVAYGVDGDGDGIADPYNFRDSIHAMAGVSRGERRPRYDAGESSSAPSAAASVSASSSASTLAISCRVFPMTSRLMDTDVAPQATSFRVISG